MTFNDFSLSRFCSAFHNLLHQLIAALDSKANSLDLWKPKFHIPYYKLAACYSIFCPSTGNILPLIGNEKNATSRSRLRFCLCN